MYLLADAVNWGSLKDSGKNSTIREKKSDKCEDNYYVLDC